MEISFKLRLGFSFFLTEEHKILIMEVAGNCSFLLDIN